jgi:hypothetical protein
MYNLLYFSSILEIACVMFLFMILLLNILWIIMIVKKYMNYLLTGNIEEIYKLKINKKSD